MLTVALAIVVVLGCVETGVRLLSIAPPMPERLVRYASSPHLVWGPLPSSHYEGVATTGEYTNDLRHNSLGLRDDEHAFDKPPGTFRILGLGDSFTYGSGAEFEQTYLRRVERWLNERSGRGARVEIIKAGVSRFFPEPERMLLESLGARFSPDLVIVAVSANDLVDTCLGLDAVAVTRDGQLVNSPLAELGTAGVALYEHSHAARILLRAWVSRNVLRRCRFGPGDPDAPAAAASWRAMEAELARMAGAARAIGAGLLVISIPDPPPWTEGDRYPARRLTAWAAGQGVGFLDLLPAMEQAREAGGPPLYWDVDPHCTPAGYAVIATALTRHLLSAGLVP